MSLSASEEATERRYAGRANVTQKMMFVCDGSRYTEYELEWKSLAVQAVRKYAETVWYDPDSILLTLKDAEFKHFKVPPKWGHGYSLMVLSVRGVLDYLELIMWKLFHDTLNRGEKRTRDWFLEAKLMFQAIKKRCQVLVALRHRRTVVDDFNEYGMRLKHIHTSQLLRRAHGDDDEIILERNEEEEEWEEMLRVGYMRETRREKAEREARERVDANIPEGTGEDDDDVDAIADSNGVLKLDCGTNLNFLFDVSNMCDEVEHAFIMEAQFARSDIVKGTWDVKKLEKFRRFIYRHMLSVIEMETVCVAYEEYVCKRVCTPADVRIHSRKNRRAVADPVEILMAKDEEAAGLDFRNDDIEYEVNDVLVKAPKVELTLETLSSQNPVRFSDWMFEYAYLQFQDRHVAYAHYRIFDRFVLRGTNRWYPSVSEMMVGEGVMEDEFLREFDRNVD